MQDNIDVRKLLVFLLYKYNNVLCTVETICTINISLLVIFSMCYAIDMVV